LRLKLRLRDISAIDTRYRYLDGSSHDLRVEGRWKLANNAQFRTYYEIQFNDRNDRTTATTFTSFSPLRQRIRADYTFNIKQGWEGRIAGEYRISDYPDANIETGGVEIKRKDDRMRALLEATKPINRDTSTTLSYTYTDNSSNIDRYTYQRNVLMANINYSF